MMAIVDGVETTIESTFSNGGSSVELDWTFPHFDNTLVYDPTINENNDGNEMHECIH